MKRNLCVFAILLMTLYSCDPIFIHPFFFEKGGCEIMHAGADNDSVSVKVVMRRSTFLDFQMNVKTPKNYDINADSLKFKIYSYDGRTSDGRVTTDELSAENDSTVSKTVRFQCNAERMYPIALYQLDICMSGFVTKNGQSLIKDTIVLHPILPNPDFKFKGYKKVEKLKRKVEQKIPELSPWAASATYPVYELQAYGRFPKYNHVPTFWEISLFMEYTSPNLAFVLAKKDDDIWRFERTKKRGAIHYEINKDDSRRLFDYIERTRPDRVYLLFGMPECMIVEKGPRKCVVKKEGDAFRECELCDVFASADELNETVAKTKTRFYDMQWD